MPPDEDSPNLYRLEISDIAQLEIDAAYLWLSGRSPEAAYRWLLGLDRAISSLSVFPTRCPVAPEDEDFTNVTVRTHLYGKSRGVYRILFCVFEDNREVRNLHVRHSVRERAR